MDDDFHFSQFAVFDDEEKVVEMNRQPVRQSTEFIVTVTYGIGQMHTEALLNIIAYSFCIDFNMFLC